MALAARTVGLSVRSEIDCKTYKNISHIKKTINRLDIEIERTSSTLEGSG